MPISSNETVVRTLKNILLMRHGDARPASASNGRDHDRPLSKAGRERSLASGKILLQQGLVPEIILASSAVRCLQTGEVVSRLVDPAGEVQSIPDLYLATADRYFQAVHQIPDRISTALLIGHNPAIEAFAHGMRAGGAAVGPFECAALACISLEIGRWDTAVLHAGHCLCFITPERASGFHQ